RRTRTARPLPGHVPSVRVRDRHYRPERPRHAARRARPGDRPRAPAGAAHQRQRDSAGLQSRPSREHRRRGARRRTGCLPLAPEAARSAGLPRGAGEEQEGAERRRAGQSPRAPRAVGRYRWLILAAGTLSATSLSAVQIGIAAITPALRTHFQLSLAQIGIVLGATNVGMTLTLLP